MNSFFRFALVFALTYFLLLWVFPPKNPSQEVFTNDIDIVFSDTEITVGKLVSFTIQNHTNAEISLGGGNPPQNIFIERYENGQWKNIITNRIPSELVNIPAKGEKIFSFSEQNTEFFGTPGQYRVRILEASKEFFGDVTIKEPGFFATIWRTLFWKPVYNALITLLILSAGSLGLAVILLTLLVKILLLRPTYNAMKSQKKMQKIQPDLQRIRDQYKGDQQKIATESMALWKKHDVNPFSSFLPILIQFPVMIALYYVVMEGLLPHNHYFLYQFPFLKDFDFSGIITNFLGVMPLDMSPLQSYSLFWLPIVVAGSQYYAMKLSFARAEKQKSKEPPKPKVEGAMPDFATEFQKMNKVFIYLFPGMVGFFTITMPSAVGIYWLVSTLFGIGQQYMVNKEG